MEASWPMCQGCGKPYNSRRSDSKYCDDGCKQKHYRQRKKEQVTKQKIAEPTRLESTLVAYTIWSAQEVEAALVLLKGALDAEVLAVVEKKLAKVIRRSENLEIRTASQWTNCVRFE
ncbi:MAG: hypothetical protein EOP45_19600, partial [Sphingobacteriaceae bacterium]